MRRVEPVVVMPTLKIQGRNETLWCSHLGGNRFRCLHDAVRTTVRINLPPQHPLAHHNGQAARLRWGMLLEGHVDPADTGFVVPTRIVGEDFGFSTLGPPLVKFYEFP